MFEQEVQRTLDYIARGINVRIVGASGSGRTSVAQRVVAALEKTGATVYFLSGLRTHRRVPFAGISTVGLDMRIGSLGVLGVADVMNAQLAKTGRHIVVVDDVEFIDNESLAVLESVASRSRRPFVITMREPRLFGQPQLGSISRGREAHVQLHPLRYEQVSELIAQTLGAPADADATARVLTKSAGNPRLVVRIVETASLSNLMELRDGQWRMTGDTLWNDHLRGTVETLLEDLEGDEVTAIHAMSLVGAAPLEALQKVIQADVMDSLERRGFISLMEDQHRCITAAISPPIVADYFRAHGNFHDRHILRHKVARVLDALPHHPQAEGNTSDALAGILAELRSDGRTDDAAAARHFHERVQARERSLYEQWEADKSLSAACALLRLYWGTPADAGRLERVLTETRSRDGASGDRLFFGVSRALWAIHASDEVDHAIATLMESARQGPDFASDAAAAAIFLRATHHPTHPDVEAFLGAAESNPGDARGLPGMVLALLELYRFHPDAALAALNGAGDLEGFPRIDPFIRGMALFAAGKVEDSLLYALERRAEARRTLDQFGVVTSSYVAAQGLVYCGYFDEAELLMSSVFAMGRPSRLLDSLYDAMLRLAGLRGATTVSSPSPTLAAHARKESADIGPLPGIGKAVYELTAKRPIQPEFFDRQAAALLQRQLDHGYVLEAVMSGLFFTCLLPGRGVLDLLRRTLRDTGVACHDQLIALAAAVVEEDHQLLGVLVQHYERDADLYPVAMLLRGAFKRYVLNNDPVSAAVMDRAATVFAARFPTSNEILAFNTSDYLPLTVREIEIAAMAGHRSNVEIAEHLGISIRTVESHISNALRKTGTTTRSSLFEVVRNSYPSQ